MRSVSEIWLNVEPKVMYLPKENRLKVLAALCVAALAHSGQKRKSGEPYIVHPVAVMELLASLQVQVDVLVSGLLHDAVEDNPDIDFLDIEVLFGRDVRKIVEGETKVSSKTRLGSRGSWTKQWDVLSKFVRAESAAEIEENRNRVLAQAENLRDMFLAMADDSRIILVKLADRLHNMQTLEFMSEAKQATIARETIIVFVPLAHRLGVYRFKTALEDLCFKYLLPNDWAELDRQLRERRSKYSTTLTAAAHDLDRMLQQDARALEEVSSVSILDREKGMYSLWYKMKRNDKYRNNIDNVHDIIALRVVLDVKRFPGETDAEYDARANQMCYHVLSMAFTLPYWYAPHAGAWVKDYIRFPKPNGYRSLHTTLLHDNDGVPLEIQIRTREMDDVAEFGMASHYVYKSGQRGEKTLGEEPAALQNRRVAWLAKIKERSGEAREDPAGFVLDVLREELGKRCFVFLRDGTVLNLVAGTTALDAAFKVHTAVGLRMAYPEINQERVAPSYTLQNGDVINIVTSEQATPKVGWLKFAFLRSTRKKLQRYFQKRRDARLASRVTIDLASAMATAGTVASITDLLLGRL